LKDLNVDGRTFEWIFENKPGGHGPEWRGSGEGEVACLTFWERCRDRGHVLSWRRWFVGVIAKWRRATISFVLSLHPSACNNSVPTGRIFMIFVFFGNMSKNWSSIKVWQEYRYCTWRPTYIFVHI
jgi:hypothetical protein